MFTVYRGNHRPPEEPGPKKLSIKRCMKIELKNVRDNLTDFCNATSVNGVRYLVATDRPLIERLWWASVLATSLYYATIYALALWKRWQDSPMEHTEVISYERIEQIPFPAITFCDNMKDITENETEILLLICGHVEFERSKNITDVEQMIEIAPPFNCSGIFAGAVNTSFDCDKMFTRTITRKGVCYAFNMMDANEIFREGVISNYVPHNRKSTWDPDTGFKAEAESSTPTLSYNPLVDGEYPLRAKAIPYITIAFQNTSGSYCENEGPGIQVMFHSPHEMPIIERREEVGWVLLNDDYQAKEKSFTNLQFGYLFSVELDPVLTWADEGMRIFKPNQRKCYFTGEKILTYFKHYTLANCENECLINKTIEYCSCVDFYMPHFESTRICFSETDIQCVIETMDWLGRRGKKVCNCYPACREINYNELIYGKHLSKIQAGSNQNDSLSIAAYVPDEFYISKQQKQSQWTIVDLVASCGGVFGLFCGLSLIAVVEFFYYTTIRVISNFIRLRWKKQLQRRN